ncbi:MAG: hypothetical protein D6733_05285 [Methanobacteriota archaeon]|nr:MAG: hypothetical protein D6733_05285 [Euryarchaeota archaeon]
MSEEIKSKLRDYWSNFKKIFPRKSMEDGKARTRAWAMDLKKEIKLDADLEQNWESYVDRYLDELEKEWPDW